MEKKYYRLEIMQNNSPFNIYLDGYNEEVVNMLIDTFKDKKIALFGMEKIKGE